MSGIFTVAALDELLAGGSRNLLLLIASPDAKGIPAREVWRE